MHPIKEVESGFWAELAKQAYKYIQNALKDDIFPPQPVAYQGLPDGTPQVAHITGHNASYYITYDWHME